MDNTMMASEPKSADRSHVIEVAITATSPTQDILETITVEQKLIDVGEFDKILFLQVVRRVHNHSLLHFGLTYIVR